jgi:hypothetical protein
VPFSVPEKDQKRFEKYLKRDGECLLWTGGTGSTGYGQFKYKGKIIASHRFSWMMKHNIQVPEEISMSHTCDTPACCNPLHLFPSSHKENMHDMIIKGRKVCQKGENNSQSRLTWDDVEIIREARKMGYKLKDIAGTFNISIPYLKEILSNRAWKEDDL